MQSYILKRSLWAIPTFFVAITAVFLVMNILPGDIAEVIIGEETGVVDPERYDALREELGLDDPVIERYASWMGGVLRGDLGESLWRGESVTAMIVGRLPYTTGLVLFAIIISIVTAVPAGVVSAVRRDTWVDYGLRGGVIAGISIPDFWLGVLLLTWVVSTFRWSPPLAYATLWSDPWTAVQQYILPSLVLGFRASAGTARMMRSAMLDVMEEDYVRTARAKGLTERVVLFVHALRNATLPVVTLFGTSVAYLFGGTVIIETVFNIPGLGLLLIQAIERRDVILVQGVVVFVMVAVLVTNLLVDILYARLDPRISYEGAR